MLCGVVQHGDEDMIKRVFVDGSSLVKNLFEVSHWFAIQHKHMFLLLTLLPLDFLPLPLLLVRLWTKKNL